MASSNGFCGSKKNRTQMTQIGMIYADLNYFYINFEVIFLL